MQIVVFNFSFFILFIVILEDFDDGEDSDEMPEEGTKYLYSNRNL